MANNRFIDTTSSIPKYIQLYEILKHNIENGVYEIHQPIPPNVELAKQYGVSMTTVREALSKLSKIGLVYAKHGVGTFVLKPSSQHHLTKLQCYSDYMRSKGQKPGQIILSFEFVDPTEIVSKYLELDEDVKTVLRIERIRLSDGNSIGLHTAYLNLNPRNSFSEQDLQDSGSLYSLLAEKYNLIPIEANEIIEAIIADEHMAKLLNTGIGSPLLHFERVTISSNQRPMEYVQMIYRADLYKCYVNITK